MSQILTINKSGLGNYSRNARDAKRPTAKSGSILNFKKSVRENPCILTEKSTTINFKSFGFLLVSTIVFCGIVYLYQVNDLANKGYEMKEAESQIAHLKEVNEKNKIKEVELRSMYNIEKVTESLDLVSSDNISYLELNGPVAMK